MSEQGWEQEKERRGEREKHREVRFPEDHWISSLSSLRFSWSSRSGRHSCFRAGGFALQSPDERAALSRPAGRSVKAISPGCPPRSTRNESGTEKERRWGGGEKKSRGHRWPTRRKRAEMEKWRRGRKLPSDLTPSPPPWYLEWCLLLLTLLNRFQCYFLRVYMTVNHSPYGVGGYGARHGGGGGGHPSHRDGGEEERFHLGHGHATAL